MKRYTVFVNSTCSLTGEGMGGKESWDTIEEAQADFDQMVADSKLDNDDTQIILRDNIERQTIKEYQDYED